jgi:O-antigen/teichoic acid export membrane protein
MKNKINYFINKFKNHNHKKDFIYSYVVNLSTMFGGLILMFLINRYASLEIYGEVAIVITLGGIVNNIITAKSNEGIVKFKIKYQAIDDFKAINQILLTSLTIDIFLAFLALIVFYFIAPLASEYFLKDIDKFQIIVYFGFIVALKLLRNSLMGYLQSEKNFILINNFTLGEVVLKVLFILLLIFMNFNITTANIIICYLISAGIISFLMYLLVLPLIIKNLFTHGILFTKSVYREFILFAKTLYLATFIRGFAADMDNIILGFFTNPQTVGLYQTIKNLISPISLISSPIGMIYYPILTKLYEDNKIQEFKDTIYKLTKYILIITSGILIILIPFDMHILQYFKIDSNITIFGYLVLQSIFMFLIVSQWWIRLYSNIVDINLYLKVNIFWVLYLGIVGTYLTYLFGLIGLFFSGITMVFLMNRYFIKKLKGIENGKR